MNWIEPLIIVLTFVVMIVGLVGTVLPALPGIELIWLAGVAYGAFSWWTFNATSWWSVAWLILFTLLLIIGEMLSYFVAYAAPVKTGASWQAIVASIVLGFIGMFVIPIIGALLGAILGVFLVEWMRRKNWQEAMKATTGALWGYGLSIGVQFIFGILMMGVWGIWIFVR